jgi:uroporphyrinogen-III synthase
MAALAGLGVLVTRPEHQAHRLCQLIEAEGGQALRFPALAITAVPDRAAVRAAIGPADRYQLIVFTSANAVRFGADLLGQRRDLRLAAVGRATAMTLEESGRPPDLVPGERYDSESLLALPELSDPRGWRVLIVRGEGGRTTLADTLTSRGAAVSYAEVYRRDRPDVDSAPLVERWPAEIQLVTATSDEVLLNLHAMLGDAATRLLASTPLAVLSERTATTARDLGVRRVGVARRADDQAMLEVLIDLSQEDLTWDDP